MTYEKSRSRGAVSIFVVLFTALLVTIVTASFIKIMLSNQEQATNNDLSQSAHDSAMAGVEDAKRALVKLRQCEASGDAACVGEIKNALNSDSCESLGQDGGAKVTRFNTEGEAQVGNERLNQAYTCVKVTLDTTSVEDDLSADDDVQVIPLRGVSDFVAVKVSWFRIDDMPSTGATPTFDVEYDKLTAASAWPNTQPALMRTQLIQFKKGDILLSRFDEESNPHAKTKFLYPSTAGLSDWDFATDFRLADGSRNLPASTQCAANFNTTDYLCSATIALPAIDSREAYLELMSLYNKAHFKLELISSSGTVVKFDGVQPVVDSTGRASDLFRRVKARVSVTDNGSKLQFPNAALNVRGSLCKDFFLTDDKNAGFVANTNGASCDPAS